MLLLKIQDTCNYAGVSTLIWLWNIFSTKHTNRIPFHIPSLAEPLEQYNLVSQQLRMPGHQHKFEVRKATKNSEAALVYAWYQFSFLVRISTRYYTSKPKIIKDWCNAQYLNCTECIPIFSCSSANAGVVRVDFSIFYHLLYQTKNCQHPLILLGCPRPWVHLHSRLRASNNQLVCTAQNLTTSCDHSYLEAGYRA